MVKYQVQVANAMSFQTIYETPDRGVAERIFEALPEGEAYRDGDKRITFSEGEWRWGVLNWPTGRIPFRQDICLLAS